MDEEVKKPEPVQNGDYLELNPRVHERRMPYALSMGSKEGRVLVTYDELVTKSKNTEKTAEAVFYTLMTGPPAPSIDLQSANNVILNQVFGR